VASCHRDQDVVKNPLKGLLGMTIRLHILVPSFVLPFGHGFRSAAVILASLLGLAQGCGPVGVDGSDAASIASGSSGGVCKVEPDQKESFMVYLPVESTVKVKIDSRFSTSEQSKIKAALSTWNQWSKQTSGLVVFLGQVESIEGIDSPQTAGDCGFSGSDESSFSVIKQDSSARWESYQLDSTNPAVTIRCQRGTQLLKQAVLINTRYATAEQFQSIVLHELGHSLGLDHSCVGAVGSNQITHESTGAESAPSGARFAQCSTLSDGHSYRKAVMFPVLESATTAYGEAEIKEKLQFNDQLRSSCIFKGQSFE
jgi:hypothetical protein